MSTEKQPSMEEAIGLTPEQDKELNGIVLDLAKDWIADRITKRSDLAKELVIALKNSFFHIDNAEATQFEITMVALAMKMQHSLTHTEIEKKKLLDKLLEHMPEELRGLIEISMGQKKDLSGDSCDCGNCSKED